jgi:hypothetical protein
MQIKQVGLFFKDLHENDFVHEKCPITILKCSVEFLQEFRKWFDLVWIQYAKDIKKIRKTEKEKKKRKEKYEMDPRQPFRPRTGVGPRPISFPPRTGTLRWPLPR